MHRILGRVAQGLAGLGLLLIMVSAVMPVPTVAGLALCLPWCQLRRGHFVLERLSRDWAPTRVWLLEALGAVIITLLLLTLAGHRVMGWLADDGFGLNAAEGLGALALSIGFATAALIAFWQAALLLAARVAFRSPAGTAELS